MRNVKENIGMGDKKSNTKGVSPQLVPQQITTLAGVCDILFGMRRCRISLPNRCYHLISRVAHRVFEFEGLQAANRKGRYDKEKLLWQFTVAIRSDPAGSLLAPAGSRSCYLTIGSSLMYRSCKRRNSTRCSSLLAPLALTT